MAAIHDRHGSVSSTMTAATPDPPVQRYIAPDFQEEAEVLAREPMIDARLYASSAPSEDPHNPASPAQVAAGLAPAQCPLCHIPADNVPELDRLYRFYDEHAYQLMNSFDLYVQIAQLYRDEVYMRYRHVRPPPPQLYVRQIRIHFRDHYHTPYTDMMRLRHESQQWGLRLYQTLLLVPQDDPTTDPRVNTTNGKLYTDFLKTHLKLVQEEEKLRRARANQR